MSESGSLFCPVDGGALVAQAHGAGEFHACYACRGLWIPRQFLIALKEKAERLPVAITLDPLPPIAHEFPLGCPECGGQMVERRQDSVPVDLCPNCKAMWLDGDELAHMAKAAKKSRPVSGAGATGLGRAEDWTRGDRISDDPEVVIAIIHGVLSLLRSFLR